jgi:hypothetical protein
MASNRVMYNATMKALEYVSEQIARQNCCDPYDCMCHEQCYVSTDWACDSCEYRGQLYNELKRYTLKRNVPMGEAIDLAYKAVKEDREMYYRETRHEDNAGAHWSDKGGYNAE